MCKHLLNALLNISGLMLLLFSMTAYPDDNNPHIINKQTDKSACNTCHIQTPELKNDDILNTNGLPVDISQFKPESEAICMSCHPRDHVHQNVSGKIIFSLPPDMPISQDKKHICQTCHYSHGKLDSKQALANVNFIDKLFDTERLHKSFLLRRDNSDGGLCLTCHTQNNYSK